MTSTYPGQHADQIILESRIAEFERRERVHDRSPNDATDAARELAANAVDKQRALMARRAKRSKLMDTDTGDQV